MKYAFLLLLIFCFSALSACSPVAETQTPLPEACPACTSNDTPVPQPTAASQPERLTLYYEGNAQVELVSPAGIHILFDVFNPAKLVREPTENDVLLSTHKHADHYYQAFAEKFPGKSLVLTGGKFELGDVHVEALFSSGAYGNSQIPDSNTIYIVDMAGLRVAHLGDIAQPELTSEQLAALHDIDIIVTVLDSQFGDMTVENENGYSMMKQIKPKFIIPTHHVTSQGIGHAVELWGGYILDDPLTISANELPSDAKLLVMGTLTRAYANLYDLQAWGNQ